MPKLGLQQSTSLNLQQKLVITPQLQQAIKLLQLNHVELAEMLQDELLENPLLEMQEVDPDAEPGDAEAAESEAAEAVEAAEAADSGDSDAADSAKAEGEQAGLEALDATAAKEPAEGEGEDVSQEELFKEIDWEAYFQDMESTFVSSPSIGGDFDPDLPSLEQRVSEEESLSEHLVFQLHMAKLNRDQQRMALLIIGSLDDRGWLALEDQGDDDPLDILAHQMINDLLDNPRGDDDDLTDEELFAYWRRTGDVALRSIHRMEPVGVGARSLEECLLLQAWQRDDLKDPDLIERLLRDHLNDIERKRYTHIGKKIKISLNELLESVEVISQLDPYPSRNFVQQPTAYISPDIYVRKVGDDYEVMLNDDGQPQLKINNIYKQMLRQQSKENREFIQEKMRNAQWLLRSIQQRKRTIFRVTESIVERQREFLEHGVSHLKPMILRDVAQDIKMHESTISRVTTNKYVHTPQGVYELKFFFTSSLQSSEGGEDVSSLAVKEKIRQLIDDESPKKPLSDQAIVKILASEGVDIARRTVAKYRGMLNIPSSSKRKRPY
ncbi:MAG: RNA polymerase sigma-54 factor [Deltaproteobacteria bacterium]|nr:MAG: RNA polymerase sigma-54 factor [Deltaproteobacteria bacterium]